LPCRVWTRFRRKITGPFKDELTFKTIKGLEQPKGTNLCGFYVCETTGGSPVSGELVTWTFLYINNIYSFILLPSIVLSFIQLIYIHIHLLLKDVDFAGEAPTSPALMSNSRGISGISNEGGPRSKRRTLCGGRGTIYVI
jgi:hypothetical protein